MPQMMIRSSRWLLAGVLTPALWCCGGLAFAEKGALQTDIPCTPECSDSYVSCLNHAYLIPKRDAEFERCRKIHWKCSDACLERRTLEEQQACLRRCGVEEELCKDNVNNSIQAEGQALYDAACAAAQTTAPQAARPPTTPTPSEPPGEPPVAQSPCVQVTEEIAKFDGKRSYSRCQDNYIQLRPTCQAPTEPPQDVPVDCRTVEYAPGKLYAGCDQSFCTKTRTRSFEELLEAIGHGDRYPIPEQIRLKNFLIDMSSAEWALLKERQGELRPLYWEGLLWAMDQMAWESDQLLRRARVHGVDELRRFHENVRRLLHEKGLNYQPYDERLYEQTIAVMEREDAHARQRQEFEEARLRTEAAEERYKVLEEQRQRLREYEQMSELDKWRTIVRDNTPGLRLMNPEHRKVFLDPDSHKYERLDAAFGPMGGEIPWHIGTEIERQKAMDKAWTKLTDPSTDLTWTDVGVATMSAVPGLGTVATGIEIAREERRNAQKSKELLEFWEAQRRQEESQRTQPAPPRD